MLIPKDRYDPFEVLAIVKGWEREDAEPNPLWWRVAIQEPGGRTIEVDTPSGYTLADSQAYADRYHGPGCVVTRIAGLPKPRAPVLLDEVLRTACDGVTGITPAQFRSRLSPEDIDDIAAGGIHPKILCGYALSFAEGMRSRRVGAQGNLQIRQRP